MPRFNVAHIREQGRDLIIVLVNKTIAAQSTTQQQDTADDLQARASAAGLAGTVALVWDGGFFAPKPWHPYFRTLGYERAASMVNRELHW